MQCSQEQGVSWHEEITFLERYPFRTKPWTVALPEAIHKKAYDAAENVLNYRENYSNSGMFLGWI